MVERLWSGWRAAYVGGASSNAPGDGRTVFTRLLESGLPDDETHIVHRGDTCFVVVNAFPYTSGHLLVVPYRPVADLDELDAAETADLWATVTDAVRAGARRTTRRG